MIRPATFVGFVVLVACAFGLFQVKYRVQDLRRDLAELNRQLDQERDTTHVLKAEWAYLNQPDRLRQLANKHLALQPVMVSQLQDEKPLATKAVSVVRAESKGNRGKEDMESLSAQVAALTREHEAKAARARIREVQKAVANVPMIQPALSSARME